MIIISYLQATTEEAAAYTPKVIHVDEDNQIVALGNDLAQAVPEATDQVSPRDA